MPVVSREKRPIGQLTNTNKRGCWFIFASPFFLNPIHLARRDTGLSGGQKATKQPRKLTTHDIVKRHPSEETSQQKKTLPQKGVMRRNEPLAQKTCVPFCADSILTVCLLFQFYDTMAKGHRRAVRCAGPVFTTQGRYGSAPGQNVQFLITQFRCLWAIH